MTASELVENAIKYGESADGEHGSMFQFALTRGPDSYRGQQPPERCRALRGGQVKGG